MSKSESRGSRPAAETRILSGSASSTSLVVSGITYVDGCSASSSACDCIISTGRVLPGSGPRGGVRSASQISPRLGIRIFLDRGEFGVHPHALFPHALRDLGQPLGPQPRRHLPVHAADGNPNVLGPWNPKPVRETAAFIQQLVG